MEIKGRMRVRAVARVRAGARALVGAVADRRPRVPGWPPRLRGVPGRRLAVQAVMAACVLALLPSAWTHASASDRLRTTADAPAADVAVVFGAGLWRGRPTPYLADRLDAAAELYRTGKVRVVLVTGDNSRKEYDEPASLLGQAFRASITHGQLRSIGRPRT